MRPLKVTEFPSPLGASYFQIPFLRGFLWQLLHRFRPLSGHLISKYSTDVLIWQKNRFIVSVPSRGILFPNLCSFSASYSKIVSVPSRGILFPNNFFQKTVDILAHQVSVPSRGILFPNNMAKKLTAYERERSFRPLSGHLISKSMKKILSAWIEQVSVPSRGILFPNWRATTSET